MSMRLQSIMVKPHVLVMLDRIEATKHKAIAKDPEPDYFSDEDTQESCDSDEGAKNSVRGTISFRAVKPRKLMHRMKKVETIHNQSIVAQRLLKYEAFS
jgi:hypothetical protein